MYHLNNKLLFFILIAILTFELKLPVCSKPYDSYEQLLSDYKNLTLDENNIYQVNSFFMELESATLSLDSGIVYFFKPMNGRVWGAVFQGTATFTFTPTMEIEKKQIIRILEKPGYLEETVKEIIMVFGDSTAEDIMNVSNKINTRIVQKTKEFLNVLFKYTIDIEGQNIDGLISQTILNDKRTKTFIAFLMQDKFEPLMYIINPQQDEEVELRKANWDMSEGYYTYSICQLHKMEELQTPKEKIDVNLHDEINIYEYNIDSKIKDGLKYSATTKIKFVVKQPDINWLGFNLNYYLKISRITDKNGHSLKFYKTEKYSTFWVNIGNNYKIGDSLELNLDYAGDLFIRIVDRTYIRTSSDWYPLYSYHTNAIFNLKFEYPENYSLVSVGELVKTDEVDDYKIAEYSSKHAVKNAAFNLGAYDLKEYTEEKVNVDVYYTASTYRNEIANDTRESYKFYTDILGDVKPKKLVVTELPSSSGTAFEGLIKIPDNFFSYRSNTGYEEAFIAHEVAHQWWGIGVMFDSYRDQWLSEGFSEYLSLMYLHLKVKNQKDFFRLMETYKRNLIDLRKSILGKGTEGGPIAIGYRNNMGATHNDYDIIVYQKGAWVLHMLRNILLDLNTFNEDVFFDILKEFYTTYKDKQATTENFRKLIERKTKFDFSWFFDQWVNNTKIPNYKYAYKVEPTPDNQFRVKMRVKQEGVDPNFKMLMPLTIQYNDDKLTRLRVLVNGDFSEFELPLLPLKPESITLVDLQAVLCDTEEVDWDDF